MRAFIALEVPEEVKQKAETLQNDFRMEGLTLVKKDAMHITLQFLGEVDAGQAERVAEAIKKIRFAPFRVSLSGLSYFTPRLIRVIFVEVAEGGKELRELYLRASTALSSSGIAFEQESYTPHFTIARVKRVKDVRGLREAIDKNSKTALGSFEAKSMFLKESTLSASGPVYRNLYELKL